MFNSFNEMMEEIFKKDKHIADLEAKLVESEKQIKDAREARDMAVDSWCKNRRKYEAQIAEMQNKSFILYSMLYETLEKQGCEDIASQIDQMTGWTYDKEADWFKGNRNYDQLKQQLAEKDKEETKTMEDFEKGCQEYYKSNQKAIEELRLALDNFRNRPTYFDVARQELCLSEQDKQFIDFISNRIKELGGEDV